MKSKFISDERIHVLGTERISKKEKKITPNYKRDTFLFLPEGDLIECYPIVDLSIELSKLKPNYKFILRFHPITDVKRLKEKRPVLLNPPSNLIISNSTIETDYKRSHFAIYRGSTTIIKAIQNGIIPIIFKNKNEMNIDPIDSLSNFKKMIQFPSDITKIIETDEDTNVKNLKKLIIGVKEYFSPINLGKINVVKTSIR